MQEKWDGLKSKLEYEQLEAERTTVSINFSAEVDVLYKGKSMVVAEKISAYRGIVLWRHEAVAGKGVEASTPSVPTSSRRQRLFGAGCLASSPA